MKIEKGNKIVFRDSKGAQVIVCAESKKLNITFFDYAEGIEWRDFTQGQVKDLLPHLLNFVVKGEL